MSTSLRCRLSRKELRSLAQEGRRFVLDRVEWDSSTRGPAYRLLVLIRPLKSRAGYWAHRLVLLHSDRDALVARAREVLPTPCVFIDRTRPVDTPSEDTHERHPVP